MLALFNYWLLPAEQRDADDRGEQLIGRDISAEIELMSSGQFIDLGDLKLNAPATIGLWIKGDALDDDQRLFVHLAGAADQAGSLRFDKRRLQVYDGIGKDWQTLIGKGLEPGRWAHVAIVYEADGRVTGYLNGQTQQTATSAFAFHGVHAAIGAKWLGQWGNTFRGTIRHLRIFNKALSPDEIQSLAAQRGNPRQAE